MTRRLSQKIRRRRYLATIGTSALLTGLAGCSGGDNNGSSDGGNSPTGNAAEGTRSRTPTGNGPTETPTRERTDRTDTEAPTSDEPTETSTEGGGEETSSETPTTNETTQTQIEPNAEVVDSEVFVAPAFRRDEDVTWVRVDVQNNTSIPHREVQVETRVRADDDSILATRQRYTLVLPANTTWRYYFQFFDINAEEVGRAEHIVVQQEAGIRGSIIDEAEILNSSLSASRGSVDITGEIDIGEGEFSRVTIVGLVYDSEGQFRGALRYLEPNPNATETIAFSMSSGTIGYLEPESAPDPTNYEVLVVGGSV